MGFMLLQQLKNIKPSIQQQNPHTSKLLTSPIQSPTTKATTDYYNFMNQAQQIIREHPERMPLLKDVTPTLDFVENMQRLEVPNAAELASEVLRKPIKKAKWHLGIRSQSKPQDIMNEVFKAMRSSGMQWKYYNSSIYNLRVRKKVSEDRFCKIGLQLYQVDQKSYLLDFRMFDNVDENKQPPEENQFDAGSSTNSGEINHHHMMEFFELCAGLIGSLAR
jgi:5'-AMP-activated protein kinase catalytic alpha subunit